MEELIAFLRARLDEDAATARRAGDSFRQIGETGVIVATEGDRAEECASANWAGIAEHIVRHDPARVLAEVDAKRRIIDECAYWLNKINESATAEIPYPNLPERGEVVLPVITLLGLPYADHPDYRAEWRP